MYELPLFPLNSVLFPGTPIHLHIFEERYQRMIGLCLEEQRPFGVILIRQGVEALGPLAEPYTVGCQAHIVHTQRLEQGRMNIVALGRERFRVASLDAQAEPYLVGMVEPFELELRDPREVQRQAALLHGQLERMTERLSGAGVGQFDLSQLPSDPAALAYMAAAILQISPEQKQELLELPAADELLRAVRTLYRRELALLASIVKGSRRPPKTVFSEN